MFCIRWVNIKKVKKFISNLLKRNRQSSWKTKAFITTNVGSQKTISSKSSISERTKFVDVFFYIALSTNQRDAILSLLSVSKRKRRNDVVKEIWKMGRRKSAETFEEILNMASLVLSFSVEFTHAVQHHSAMSTCISQ